MGYQESYVTSGKMENFQKIIDRFRAIGKARLSNDIFIDPVLIITLKKQLPGTNFEVGHKFVYVVGERSGQRDIVEMFDNQFPTDAFIIFTEEMPSESIFDDNSGWASKEPFDWGENVSNA